LDLAVHQELVAEEAVGVEGVEGQQPGGGVKQPVGQAQRDVELREAGQVEAGALVAGVEVVEE
jgi:hypothetical protein